MGPAVLRQLLEDTSGPLIVPGVHDAFSARLAQAAGFDAVYMTGSGAAIAAFGLPDLGLLTATEMEQHARRLLGATSLPLIVDADTGYGNALNVHRTVRMLEHAGVAALHLEDQQFPKRCGHLAGKTLVPAEDFVEHLDAALTARREVLVIARTDAYGVVGLDDAIARGRRYAAAGADLVFVEGVATRDELSAVRARIEAPLVVTVVPGTATPALTPAEFTALGYDVVIHPLATLAPAAGAVRDGLERLAAGEPPDGGAPTLHALFDLVGLSDWQGLEQRLADHRPSTER